jgi:CBS domain-containing protein
VPDQDNCLILSDDFDPARDDPYFTALARIVSEGLDACGYVHCVGEMMAVPARWRQPLSVWRGYFAGRIRKPDPMAQMLASVMFDLHPISGDASSFDGLHAETPGMASRNSIYLAHMTAGALKHQAPVWMLRGLALIQSRDHRDTIDLKHHGVVPVVDLGRLYALIGRIEPVNTHARLRAARDAHIASDAGGADLLAAYDLICAVRLRHQASQVRRGAAPDNYMAPSAASELDRTHLRDAFLVIRTMQQAAASGRGGGIL